MKKRIFSFLIVVIVCLGVTAYLFASRPQQSGAPALPPPAPSSTPPIRVPVDVFGSPVNVVGRSFTNTSTYVVVSFGKDVKDIGSAFGQVSVYVNGKGVGVAQEDLQSLFSFSPDNKYFGYRTHRTYGASSFGHGLTIINLASSAIIEVSSPHFKTNPGDDVIESYSWHGDAIDIVSYVVTPEYTEQPAKLAYYRTALKELWRYDLTTKQYTLLETLPESSTSTTSGGD